MKKILLILAFAILAGCKSDPANLAEKYMALVCLGEEVSEKLEQTLDEKKHARLKAKNERIHAELEKLNTRILKNYQGDEQAMEIIQQVCEKYTCKDQN